MRPVAQLVIVGGVFRRLVRNLRASPARCYGRNARVVARGNARSGDWPIVKASDATVQRLRRSLGPSWLWPTGVVAGLLAAVVYPMARSGIAVLVKSDDEMLCSMIGLCGGVPDALQDFFKSTVGLLFSFLLGYTFYILLARQQSLLSVFLEEIAVLTQIIEEAPLYLPSSVLPQLVRCLRRYSVSVWMTFEGRQMPAELSANILVNDRDAVEEMSRICIEGGRNGDEGFYEILQSVRALRLVRARRLAALQPPVPSEQFGILVLLAVLAALPPFLGSSGDSSPLSQLLYGLLVAVLVLVLALVLDVAQPTGGAYNSEDEVSLVLLAFNQALNSMEADAEEEAH